MRLLASISVLVLLGCTHLFAQVATNVVTVSASASGAYEGGGSGRFRIARSGSLTSSLTVFYTVGGTAVNGVDYTYISNNVVIPAGTNAVAISVDPIDDTLVETNESVVLHLTASPFSNAGSFYAIGTPAEAMVTIFDNDRPATNHPPVVQIVQPTNNSVFLAPVDITLLAAPRDEDGTVVTVAFYEGTNLLGSVTPDPATAGPANPWTMVWSNVAPGAYAVRAKAIDNAGAVGWSAPVNISVRLPEVPRPVVNVVVSAPGAAEGGDSGRFTILRSGDTNSELNVAFRLGGSASNGVDYAAVSGSVAFAAGQLSADVDVVPIDDTLVEPSESVVLSLLAPACAAIYPPPAGCYVVGASNVATLLIRDNDVQPTNARPAITINSPTNGASFEAPATIAITATAVDHDGSVKTIEFLNGTNKLGQLSVTSSPDVSVTATFTWNDVPQGRFGLSARAIDDKGAIGISQLIEVAVHGTNVPPPPPTNLPVIVTVTAPDSQAIEGPLTNLVCTNVVTTVEGTNLVRSTNWASLRTNAWEPNPAVFRVSRTTTNGDLVVNYVMGGTASNGVDYAALSGSVTIRAGEHSARVVVMPIDDTVEEGVETVVIRLLPPVWTESTNPPPYQVGWPREAGAIIIDNDVPRPPTTALSDSTFHLAQLATNGFVYRLECSTNLIDWVPVYTNVVTEGAVQHLDPEAATVPNRYYRVVPTPVLPPE